MTKAEKEADPFDRLLSGWIGLVVIARHRLASWGMERGTDRATLIEYFGGAPDKVAAVLGGLREEIYFLATRRGTNTGRPILDVIEGRHPEHLRKLFDELSEVWQGKLKRSDRWIAIGTAELLNAVRNNTFHGGKEPENWSDQLLLFRINSVVLAILKASL